MVFIFVFCFSFFEVFFFRLGLSLVYIGFVACIIVGVVAAGRVAEAVTIPAYVWVVFRRGGPP